MEKAKIKFIHETTVNKLVEEKVKEKRVENGEEIEVSRVVKKTKPVKIGVQRPDRRKNKEAEIFFAKRLSAYLKEGLLPHSLVTKRYINDGGPLSEGEKQLVETLRERYLALQEEYFGMNIPLTDEQTARRGDIIMELNEINKTLRDIQSNYSEVFSNTAEAKGKADVIEWWILKLSYADLDDTGYKPLFGDGNFDEQMAKLDELEAQDDPVINEIIKKLSYFISFWYTAGQTVAKEDFASAEENYEKNVTDYSIDEPKEETPAATPSPEPTAILATEPVTETKVA